MKDCLAVNILELLGIKFEHTIFESSLTGCLPCFKKAEKSLLRILKIRDQESIVKLKKLLIQMFYIGYAGHHTTHTNLISYRKKFG